MTREDLGKIVRHVWVERQKIKHPERIFQAWEDLTDFERETDCLIAHEVIVQYLHSEGAD